MFNCSGAFCLVCLFVIFSLVFGGTSFHFDLSDTRITNCITNRGIVFPGCHQCYYVHISFMPPPAMTGQNVCCKPVDFLF